jgi:putative hemolysin
MKMDTSQFEVKLAETEAELLGAQRLRYSVFVEEMGAEVTALEHAERLERDEFDQYFDHLVLINRAKGIEDPLDRVVGVYRLMTSEAAANGIGYYGASEYDLDCLIATGRKAVELGRSCVAPGVRGGVGMHLLWNGLAEYVLSRNIEIMFGVASFHGTDVDAIAPALSLLYHAHLAPEDLRVRTQPQHYVDMNRMPLDEIDTVEAMQMVPSLIKAYLRLGGFVGDGAFVDSDFNTTDVCLLMDTERMTNRYRRFYEKNVSKA